MRWSTWQHRRRVGVGPHAHRVEHQEQAADVAPRAAERARRVPHDGRRRPAARDFPRAPHQKEKKMGKGGLTRHDLADGGLSKRRRTTSGAVPRAAAVRMLRDWTGGKVSRRAAEVMTRDTLEELVTYMRAVTLAADGKGARMVRWSARAVRDMVTAHGYVWPADDAAA